MKPGGVERSGTEGAPAGLEDGRRRRSERSREKVLTALAEAIVQPDFEPTPEHVAARAGVSMSTVRRHFGDFNGLATAMSERVFSRVRPFLLGGPFVGDLRERARDLLRRRSEIFEIAGPFVRVSLRRPREALANLSTDAFHRALRAQIAEAFRPELSSGRDGDALELLDALLSLSTWDHLRRIRGIDAPRAAAILERAALACIEAPPG